MRTAATLSASGNLLAIARTLTQSVAVLQSSSSMTAAGLRYSPTTARLSASGSLTAGSSFTLAGGFVKLPSSGSLVANSSFTNLAAYAAMQATSSILAHAAKITSISQIVVKGRGFLIANGFVHGPAPTIASIDNSLILSMRKNMIGPPFIILGH
jgi:hypothetical protein